MSNLKMIRRCPGCGLILQSIDDQLPGFVPPKHVERHEVVLCQRCFKLQHYGEDIAPKESFNVDEFVTILRKAKHQNAIIIWVLDLLHFETTLSKTLIQELSGSETYVFATKRDLLPKSINQEKLKQYLSRFLKDHQFVFSDILIVSTKAKESLLPLQTLIEQSGGKRPIYLFGATSSGKSSLVNAYLKQYTNGTYRMITTSAFPGTTLRVIEIPLTHEQSIYDTPGYIADHSLLALVEKETIKGMTAKVEIKPKHYRLGAKDSLSIGGLARLDVLNGPKVMTSYYFANQVVFHKQTLAKADSSFFHMVEKKALFPTSKKFGKPESFVPFELTLPSSGRQDIALAGYGWISLPCAGQTIRLMVPKGMLVLPIPSKLSHE
jgi:ribosome biogenesis GTPase YqeH